MKIALLYSIFFLAVLPGYAQVQPAETNGLVNWLTFKEAQEKHKALSKPFLIDFYTDWCGWCKHMMRTTYSNAGIASYINAHFYPVKFNAEGKDTIEYNGKTYKPLSPEPRTPHELTLEFLGERQSYPSTIFMTNNYQYKLLVPGFIEDKKIEPLLIFMVENAWQSSTYDEFGKYFNRTFVDTVFPKTAVKIHSITEIEKLQKKKPRKVLVSIGADFCNTCRVQDKTTFADTSIASYINRNFYVVSFNAAMRDTVIFKNEKYFPTIINNYPLHNLSLKLSMNRFSLPALCLLDEELNTLNILAFYQSPERLKPILHYIASNSYKTKNYNDFFMEYQKGPSPKPKGTK